MKIKGLIYFDIYDILKGDWLDKRYFLYFDTIVYSLTKEMELYARLLGRDYYERLIEQLRQTETLKKHGLYEETDILKTVGYQHLLNDTELAIHEKLMSITLSLYAITNDTLQNIKVQYETSKNIDSRLRAGCELEAYCDSIVLHRLTHDCYLPIQRMKNPLLHTYIPVKGVNTLSIFLKSIPIISNETSWEQLIDFKNDPDTKTKFLSFRNWLTDICQQNYSAIEVAQKIEYLQDQYKQHIRYHKLKTEVGSFEIFFTTTAEVLENLVRFQFSKAIKSLFEINKQQLSLIEAERTAPGREVAFVDKVYTNLVK